MDRIGEYLIQRMVGEGGMGKVYEAEERLTKRKVALKVLRPELTRNEEGRRLFLNEMQILAHLEHPNIVRSLASTEEQGQLVMVLEFLKGRTLREELTRRDQLPWQEAVERASRIAAALEVAHAQQPPIIHRDLKPENVMLTDDGGVKVMDFGIAKVLEAAHATNTQSIGTLQYMSPEQIDAHSIDARSDLYALGLILYEMLAGKPPFHSASPRELLNLQCTATPPELDDEVRRMLPRGVEALVFALLEKKPDARPASATEVAARLAPFCAASDRTGAAPRRMLPRGDTMPSTQHDEIKDAAVGSSRVSLAAPPAKPLPAASKLDSTLRAVRDGNDFKEVPKGDLPPAERNDSGARGASASSEIVAEKPAPRLDTVALVDRGGARPPPGQISTAKAVVVIAGLSLFAGIATYMVRTHARTGDAATTTTASAATAGPPSRSPYPPSP